MRGLSSGLGRRGSPGNAEPVRVAGLQAHCPQKQAEEAGWALDHHWPVPASDGVLSRHFCVGRWLAVFFFPRLKTTLHTLYFLVDYLPSVTPTTAEAPQGQVPVLLPECPGQNVALRGCPINSCG